jgi:hypothetical protein
MSGALPPFFLDCCGSLIPNQKNIIRAPYHTPIICQRNLYPLLTIWVKCASNWLVTGIKHPQPNDIICVPRSQAQICHNDSVIYADKFCPSNGCQEIPWNHVLALLTYRLLPTHKTQPQSCNEATGLYIITSSIPPNIIIHVGYRSGMDRV